jgi:hypothetical protein
MSQVYNSLGVGADGETANQSSFTNRRRSARFSLAIPITICGNDANGSSFTENTWTITVNEHGGKLASSHRMQANSEISIENPAHGHLGRARVLSVGKGIFPEDPFEICIELIGASKIWGIKFPPRELKPKLGLIPAIDSTGGGKAPAVDDALLAPTGNNMAAPLPPKFTDPATPADPAGNNPVSSAGHAEATGGAVQNAPMDPSSLAVLQSKAESTQVELTALFEKVEQARRQLKVEVDEAERRMKDIAGPRLESTLQECNKKLESATASMIRAGVITARGQWENNFQKFLDDLAAKQLTVWTETIKGEIGRQEAAFRTSLQSEAAQTGKGLADHAENLQRVMRAETETHLEYAATQMRQETCDALILFKEELQKAPIDARASYQTELDCLTQAAFDAARQQSEAEMQSFADVRVNSFREQLAATLKQTHQEAADGILQIKAEVEKTRIEAIENINATMERHAQTAIDSAKQRGEAELQKLIEGQMNSVREQLAATLNQARQEAAEGIQQVEAEVERNRHQRIEDANGAMMREMQAAIDSARQQSETELQRLVEAQVNSARERLAEGETKLAAAGERAALVMGAAIETEYRRKVERIFAEAMDAGIRDFEVRLNAAGQDRLSALNNLLEQQIEPARQHSVEQIKELSAQAAQSALGMIQQGLGAAALMLKDWTGQATERLESAVQNAAKSSQQQMAAFMQAALEEMHRGANVEIRSLRERLRQAASALENTGQAAESGTPQAAKPAPPAVTAPAASRQLDEVSGRGAGTKDDSNARAINEVVKQIRAKLDEILKPVV